MDNLTKKYLTLKHITALGIIALLSITAFVIVHQLILTQEKTTALINASNRLRMQSQRSLSLAMQFKEDFANPQERQKVKVGILQAADSIKNAYEGLDSTSAVLDMKVKTFIEMLIALANTEKDPYLAEERINFVTNSGIDTMLHALDSVVDQSLEVTRAKIASLKIIEFVVLIMTLLTLMIDAAFFRPMVQEIVEDRENLTTINEELAKLSTLDGLTGIANRRRFDEFLTRQWDQALRNRASIALILVDIDFFKAYNDTYGHLAGDQCLKQVASILDNEAGRPTDLVARYGGEEFGVVLGGSNLAGAAKLAERLRISVKEAHLEHSSSTIAPFLTVSIGVAACSPSPGCLPSSLITSADQALYNAKSLGRNRVAQEIE